MKARVTRQVGRRVKVGGQTGLVALLCIALFGAAFRTRAVEYEVDGTIEQTINHPNGESPGIYRNDFTVFVRDSGWLIQTRRAGTNRLNASFSEIGSTNGRDVFQLSGARNTNTTNRQPFGVAQVYSNSVPVGFTDVDVVGHLWLMFASGSYLPSITNKQLTPVFEAGASAPGNPNLKEEASWQLMEAAPFLPERVTYFKQQFSGRKTNAVYQATGTTNEGGVAVPNGFVFEEYLTGGFVVGYDTRLRRRKVATVSELRPYCSRESLMPAPRGETVVADLRVKMPKEGTNPPPLVVYTYETNKGWLSTDESKAEFVQNRERLAAAQEGRNPHPLVFHSFETNKGWLSTNESKAGFVQNRESLATVLHKKKVSRVVIIGLGALLLAPALWFTFRPKPKGAAGKVKAKRD